MGAVLGIDVGAKTLGLAISDDSASVALPLRTVTRRGLRRDLDALAEVVETRGVRRAVVGWPLNLDGSPGAMDEEAEVVRAKLAERCGIVVDRYDERMSTVAAERVLIEADVSRKRRKKVVDKLAATLILQSYLDRLAFERRENGNP